MGAAVAEPLPRHFPALYGQVSLAKRLADAEGRAPCGGLDAPDRAADLERLAGDDAEDRVALVHGIRVEDPSHLPRARADVRGGNVRLRPDEVDDLRGVAARHALELGDGELLRVDDDAALRAPERKTHQRALPRHPHRERLRLFERDLMVIANAALGGAPGDVVRAAEALEDPHGAVVHARRNGDGDALLALEE